MSTFDAVDRGLKWPPGTAEAYYRGIADAKDLQGGWSTEERLEHYLTSILTHLSGMSIDELEREVLMLEEESFGRNFTSNEDATAAIRETVQRFMVAMNGRDSESKGAIGG